MLKTFFSCLSPKTMSNPEMQNWFLVLTVIRFNNICYYLENYKKTNPPFFLQDCFHMYYLLNSYFHSFYRPICFKIYFVKDMAQLHLTGMHSEKSILYILNRYIIYVITKMDRFIFQVVLKWIQRNFRSSRKNTVLSIYIIEKNKKEFLKKK